MSTPSRPPTLPFLHVDVPTAILAIVLPAVAGAVNGAGFFAVGRYTSHVTGLVGRVGDDVAAGALPSALDSASFAGAFFSGSVFATVMLALNSQRRGKYSAVLLSEATLLLTFVTLVRRWGAPVALNHFGLTALLCFAMGVQNSMVTRLSGAVVRTTHLTGVVTDLGIAVGQMIIGFLARMRGTPVPENQRFVLNERVRIHTLIFFSFLTGATVGPLLWFQIGAFTFLVPCVVLVLLAVHDYARGLNELKTRTV